MIKRALTLMAGLLIASAGFFPAFPFGGIGIHYGLDYSLSMPDETGEQASLGDLKLNTSQFGTPPQNFPYTTISGNQLPITINRINFERNWFDIGGKFYIDCIPVIDAIELSTNYGMWQYQGSIKYPKSIQFNDSGQSLTNPNITQIATIVYDSTNVTMKNLGLSNPFIQNTPYAKLQFDLTVRKFLLNLPPAIKTVRFYGGGGVSLYYATPLLSANLIQRAIANQLQMVTDLSQLQTNVFGNQTTMQKVGREFLNELFTPHYGAHIDLGAMIKFPIMPVGIYVDGKYLIPFDKMDPDVPALKSTGFLLNSGIAFAL